jgi:hypothetical protein
MTENCRDENYRGNDLPVMDGDYIIAKVDVPGLADTDLFTELPASLQKLARKMGKKKDVNRLITYFKLTSGDAFPNNSTLRLKYSRLAWDNGFDDHYGRPRIFYLKLDHENKTWVDDWEEFPDDAIFFTPPEDDDPYVYLCITIDGLPDPLIGGC